MDVVSRARDKEMIRRRCTNKEIRRIILHALKEDAPYKITKNGIIIYGPERKIAGTHFTVSDHRASKNLIRDLKKIGINIPH